MSPRNQFVASVLQQSAFATLLVDLLTEEEDQIYKNRFDIEKLTERLIGIVDWLLVHDTYQLVYLVPGTGAAAALNCTKSLEIVPGATHLFEEPGTLEKMTSLTTE
ncbi:hypothetical protein [Allofrancisella guangzhouensis]|uniref:hypothetical protein n=1 Tax=Allofrancisella guangzhouensis TaxID=594679 RepID=UPI000AD98B3D|nr:hypothetical protein [Allofrancisella guangzhouensis]